MKVVIDDKAPMQSYLKAGEKVSYSANEKIKVVLGNSTGTQVEHNGEEAKGKQYQGTIRYYIFPANAHFPQDQPSRSVTRDDSAKTDNPATDSRSEAPKTDSEKSAN